MRQIIGLTLLATASLCHAAKTLDVYFIDVEGGQATLIVTAAKQSMLVDAGWPGFNGRDAERIARVAKKAGVKAIDYMVTTHYHTDHAGGVPQLAEKLEVRTFVDHGPNNESGKNPDALYQAYEAVAAKGKRLTVKAGDTIPLKGVDVRVVTANGEHAKSTGEANALCSTSRSFPEDKSENARSIGLLLTYGKFRMVNLGDLTNRKELELACPENRLGSVDVYLTTHHGLATSNAQELVHALKPRVAVMNNGAKKGGSPEAWRTIRSSPGLEDLWQVHFSLAGGTETNSPEAFIANLEEGCVGNHIALSANTDGSFRVSNSRNKYSKQYAVR
ncbi:MAG TPA: MBL fold metallo-hydrolase [Bryobacteraceae bacterium]|nr:MBL fold metallo-hydrolase [Bryobacteraceae bacterium]